MPSVHINSKLPYEILREIFLAYIQTVTSIKIRKSRAGLCLVCRLWRQIVESHAQLWSSICASHQDPDLCPSASAVSLSLKRSMNVPLEIRILSMDQCSRRRKARIDLCTAEVLPLLAAQAFRWKSLVLDLDKSLVDEIRNIAFAKAEQLRNVDIAVWDTIWQHGEGYSGEIATVVSALAGAPNLRSFRWSSDSDLVLRHLVKTFPLERLTHFHFDFSSPMSLLKLLRVMQKCTSVVEMRIAMEPEYDLEIWEDHLPLAALPNMRTVQLSFSTAVEYDMFEYFDFPNLEIITIRWYGEEGYQNDISAISHFLSNSRHCVQVLLVSDYMLQLEGLATFLSDSAVFRIPIVQVHTISLPSYIRESILEAVETRLPDALRPEFRITTPDNGWDDTTMGWTDASTYEKFKDYLPCLDGYGNFVSTLL